MCSGTVSVRSVLLKDGHVFGVHVLDPTECDKSTDIEKQQTEARPTEKKTDQEKSEKQGNHGDPGILTLSLNFKY